MNYERTDREYKILELISNDKVQYHNVPPSEYNIDVQLEFSQHTK